MTLELLSQLGVTIYGHVYQAGQTEPGTQSPVLKSQIGYGPTTVNPATQSG